MDNFIEIHSCSSEKSIMSFPLGALCIKTALNENESLPKTVLFEHYLADSAKEEARKTAERKPYAVGLSLYIWNSEWFESFASELKVLMPEVRIFAGGPHVSSMEKCPPYLDFAVIGEGEISTVEALVSNAKGLIFAKTPNLETLSSPFLSGQADSQLRGTDSVLWELTRGCPFGCYFCYESRGKNTVRNYPFERLEQELHYIIDKEIQNVFVLDPTFNLDSQRAKKILSMLISEAPSYMHFTFEVRAELIDEELANMFATLNCSLQIGLQSSNEEVLSLIGRKFDKNEFAKKIKLLDSKGVAFGLDVIIGLPKDDLARFRETVNYAVSLQPSNIDCFLLSLLPGTKLALNKTEFGLITNNDVLQTLKSSPTFSAEDLQQAFEIKDALDLFYTKGQACMWIHCVLETLNITACNLLSLFAKWMKQTNRTVEEDIWLLQDDFIISLFEKTQNNKLIPAIRSFMELHQGFSFVTDTCEDAQLDLSYHPDDLAHLDNMSLSEFAKTFKQKRCTIVLSWDDMEGVVWKRTD